MTILTKHRSYQELSLTGGEGKCDCAIRVELDDDMIKVSCISELSYQGLPLLTVHEADQVRSMIEWAVAEAEKSQDQTPADLLSSKVRAAREGGGA